MTKHETTRVPALVLALLASHCGSYDSAEDSAVQEEKVYVSDPPPYDEQNDGDGEADGEGGSSSTLRLPFPSDEVWQLTRGYNTGSHVDYGYDWVDDTYALDFALEGCESWRKSAMPIRSGTVEVVGWDEDGYGHYVLVDHGDGFKSRYAHFDETTVSTGQSVTTSTTIGYVGNSGYVTGTACPDHPGTHLHIAYYENGDGIPPEPMSGHTDFTTGCWYGHSGWIDCDGDGENDEESGGSNSGEDDGCTWHVPSDFTSIQDAIDVATRGEVVCVDAGTYTEDLTFTGQDITVQGVDGAEATHLYGVATGSYESVVTVESGESAATVLEGFTLHPTFDTRGITVTWSSLTLRNLVIECDDSGQYGLMLDVATAVSVTNTVIADCTSYGIYGPAATGITVSNLIVRGNGSAGIRVAGGGDVEVVNSVFYENGYMAVDARQSNATVENSILVGHTLYALYLEDGGSNTLTSSYNTFDDNASAYSEDVRTTTGNAIEDPQFTNASGHDFTLRSGSSCIDAGNPSSAMNDGDGSRNDKGAYGGPFSESW